MPDEEENEEEYPDEENPDDSLEEDLDDMLEDLEEEGVEGEAEEGEAEEPQEVEEPQEFEETGEYEEYEEAPETYYEEETAPVQEEYATEAVAEPQDVSAPEPEVTRSTDEVKFDESLEELPKIGPMYGRLVDLVLVLFIILMIAFFVAAGLYTDVDKIQTIEMGLLLNIGLGGLVVIVLLYVLASNNISKGDALAKKDTPEAYRAAAEKYSAALKIDRRSKKAWTCKGLALRMQSHDERNLTEALKHHNMALKIDPKYGVAWVNKGNVLFNLGWSDEAIKCYDKAIDLNPDYTVAWVNKGEMLVKMGLRDEAQKCLDRARSLAD